MGPTLNWGLSGGGSARPGPQASFQWRMVLREGMGESFRCGQQIQLCVCSSGTGLAYKGVVFKLLEFGLVHKIHARLRNSP